MLDIEELFEKHEEEFLKFDRIKNKLSKRPDLHAFILLDSILPSDYDIVSGAGHDEIWLNINIEELAQKATEEQIIDLYRCGVHYFSEYDCLGMFA
jgi:hypothetical protein